MEDAWRVTTEGQVAYVSSGLDQLTTLSADDLLSLMGVGAAAGLPTGSAAGLAKLGLEVDPFQCSARMVALSSGDEAYPVAVQIEVLDFVGKVVSRQPSLTGYFVDANKVIHVIADGDLQRIADAIGSESVARMQLTLRNYLGARKSLLSEGLLADDEDLLKSIAQTAKPLEDYPVSASLYDYQSTGVSWLMGFCAQGVGCVLADQMGLGKTLQVITTIALRALCGVAPSLVVCPATLVENWRREFARFAPQVSVLAHIGSSRTGRPHDLVEHQVVITSYDLLTRDQYMLKTIAWDLVVLDEAQAIKNPDAQRALAAKAMDRQCGIAVTGTPLENSLLDLWSVTDFAVPGYLGDRSRYEGEAGQDLDNALAAEPLVRPLILRRCLDDVSLELPPLVDVPQALLMYEEEAWGYETLRRIAEGNGPAMAALTPLRQYCAHPSLVSQHLGPATPESAKLKRLISILAEIQQDGERAIVFAPYTEAIDLLVRVVRQTLCVPAEPIYGGTPMSSRHDIIESFNSATGSRVLVLNPAAAGTGLNITGANHVIHYSLEWNPAKVDQATARAYRKGQERPVTVHQLYYTGTVEETIVDRLERKRSLAQAAVTGTDGLVTNMSDVLRALRMSPVGTSIE